MDLSVNIVRPCRKNPRLSAWAATEGEFHFDRTPIAPPGTAMLMYECPGNRKSWGHNARKAWYLGPCFNHYRTFKGILPSTGKERMSDTVKMQHHAIAIPKLTPADRIVEAARHLDRALKQLPKDGTTEEIKAIQILREVLLGERDTPIPPNSVAQERIKQKELQKVEDNPQPTDQDKKRDTEPTYDYVSDDETAGTEPETDEEWEDTQPASIPGQGLRRSRRVIEQLRKNEMDGLERVAALTATETATILGLNIKEGRYTRG